MAQEVKLRVRGIQGGDGDNNVEVVSVGQMYEEDGALCLVYDEVVDENDSGLVQVVNNRMKIRDNQVEVIKEGPMESHMVFVPNETTYTYYSTPLGELEVSIFTKQIKKTEKSNGFHLVLRYDLEMNAALISQCSVDVVVEQVKGMEQ